MAMTHSQFNYWQKVLQLEVLLLHFLRSQHKQQFLHYVESLEKIIPWMFARDCHHYARWTTIHVKDLLHLEKNCTAAHAYILRGNFVTQKTRNKFFALAHDQVHEQPNAMVKGDGDAIDLTENEVALRRWMIDNNTYIRANWKNFLHADANKDGLFKFQATISKISISTRKAKYIDPTTKLQCGIISNV